MIRARSARRGAALLYAVLIVGLAAAVSLGGTARLADSAGRTALFGDGDQARRFAELAEMLAGELVGLDAIAAGGIDHPGEDWAAPDRAIEVDGARIVGNVADLQGRFNLASLWKEDGDLDPAAVELLDRLGEQAGVPRLSVMVAEWSAPELVALAGAAGDGPYLRADPPYLRPLRPMAGISELRLLDGIDAAAFARLEPLVTVLPRTAINVNTAPAALIRALAPDFDDRIAAELVARRQAEPFGSAAEFTAAVSEIAGPNAARGLVPAMIGASTRFFAVSAEVWYGIGRARLRSVLSRDGDGVTSVLSRSWGDP